MEPDGSSYPTSETGVGLQRPPERGAATDDPGVRTESAEGTILGASGPDVRRRPAPAPLGSAGAIGPTSPRPAAPAARPTPLPKRPKGRLFVGTVLLAVCIAAVYGVWNSFFRYRAYGVVGGRVIEVSAPWDGIVQGTHVCEGELVHQGELLATLENLELVQRRDRLGDELRIAQAGLSAEASQLQWQSQLQEDRDQRALAEYYQLWGELLQEQAQLAEFTRKLDRIKTLTSRGVMSAEECDEVRFGEAGQRAKVEKLQAAVEEMRKRAELNQTSELPNRLKAQLVRIEALQAEISRLREQVGQGEIRAPVDGRVIKRYRFAGEYADASEAIFDILEHGSLEAVIYLPQHAGEALDVGQDISVYIQPHPQPVTCTVVRVGDQLETPPQSIQRHYRANQKLLPVYATLPSDAARDGTLRLGSEVRLPSPWWGVTLLSPQTPASRRGGRVAPGRNP